MNKVKYFTKRFFSMNYGSMFKRIDAIRNKCDKTRLGILMDMIWCGIRYGAGYTDYDVIGFYKLTSAQRKTMLTRAKNDKFVLELNKKEDWHTFNNKNEFNELFNEFVKRDWMYIKDADKESVKDWISSHNVFFAKPNDGQCGKNIEKIDVAEWNDNLEKIYEYVISKELFLLEEPIKQCAKMNELNTSCVNTIRIVTLKNKRNEISFLASVVRIGNGKVVDNFNSGGMSAKINLENGIIEENAVNKKGEVFKTHPATGTQIPGFQIPYWNEIKEMIKVMAQKSENIRYVGWDVALTENGPVIVEGNHIPGHDIYQIAEKIGPNDIGVLPIFENAMKE